MEYNGEKPIRVDTVVLSTQHSPEVTLEQIRKDMIDMVIKPTIPAELLDENTKIYVNPTGRFVIGGPQGDSGLTGRKIIVDTYGGSAQRGGWTGPEVSGAAGLRHRRGPARQRTGGYLRYRYGGG